MSMYGNVGHHSQRYTGSSVDLSNTTINILIVVLDKSTDLLGVDVVI